MISTTFIATVITTESQFFFITNEYNPLHITVKLLAALSALCHSFKLTVTSQSQSAELTFLEILLILRFLILLSMTKIILFFHSSKLQMLMSNANAN